MAGATREPVPDASAPGRRNIVNRSNRGRSADLNRLCATEAAQLIAAGEITSADLVRDCIARIRARDPDVGAWAFFDPQAALAQARACDAVPRRSALHGVPVGIKDVFDTRDMPTAYGSPLYAGHRPSADSGLVSALREAGLVLLGKTVTTEFATPWPAGTRNPLDLNCSPGVSSSGSAAAVADYMVPLATGTQTGGSVIRPASYCGVYGYKSSLDELDRSGLRHCKTSLDTAGLFARSLEDIAVLRATLTARPVLEPERVASPRIALCRTHYWSMVEPSMRAALEDAAARLVASGVSIEEIESPAAFGDLSEAFATISAFEAFVALEQEREEHFETFNPWLRDRLTAGRACTPERYQAAQVVAARCRRLLDDLFERVDVLLTPSAEGAAPDVSNAGGGHGLNADWTLLHVPCVNVPAMPRGGGLPLGLQLVGPPESDDRFIAQARWIDRRLTQERASRR